MKKFKNKAFRSTFLVGTTFIVVAVTLVGGILYSIIIHANFDHFIKKSEKVENKEIVKEEVLLHAYEPVEKIVYKTDTVYIERKCLKKHVEHTQSHDTLEIAQQEIKEVP
jgi:hypothetical protein